MTSSYLFNSKGLVELSRYLLPDTLFAFDLDGTLAPIVEDFAAARVGDPVRETLARLTRVAKVAVITGRARSDALSILGVEPQLVIGNHGAEWPRQDGGRGWGEVAACLNWRNRLHSLLCCTEGVEIEYKGESLSVHYRKAADQAAALSAIEAAVQSLEPAPRLVGGKCVLNVLPAGGSRKGEALAAAMAKLGAARAVYFGDDATDEDVFVQQGIDVFGVHIGEGETAARYRLHRQSEILGLLHSMVGIMEVLRSDGEVWELR